MSEIILRTLAFLGLYALLLVYVAGLIWLGSTVLQPMWGMPLAMVVTIGGGIVLPVAILFGVMSRD